MMNVTTESPKLQAEDIGTVKDRSSLGTTITRIFGIVLLLALLTTSGLLTWAGFSSTRHEILNRQATVADLAAEKVSFFIEARRVELSTLTLANENNFDGMVEDLPALLESSPAFQEIIVTNKAGEIIGGQSRETIVLQDIFALSQSRWFNEALDGNSFLSTLQISSADEPYAILSQPIWENGDVIGVIAARLDMYRLWDVVADIAIGQTGQAYIVDGSGTLIAHREPSLVLQGINLSTDDDLAHILNIPADEIGSIFIGLDGGRVYGATAVPEGTNFKVITELPANEAEVLLRQAAYLVTFAILLALGAAFIAGQTFIKRLIVTPLTQMAFTANKLGQGDLAARAHIESTNELGLLADTINAMANRLQELLVSLEDRVEERTRGLALTIEIGNILSTILHTDQLVTNVVELLKIRFNYYHAHIYLFDEAHEYLVMVGGTGTAGKALMVNEHKIEAGKGLVGRTAVTNKPTLVPDVFADPDWLPNSLLPDTQAEVAVPIVLEGKVLGVLDVQSNVVNSLSQVDVELLQSIAGQVAIGLKNAQLFAQIEEEKEQVQAVLSSVAFPILISNISDGRVVYVNEALTETFMLPREQMIGQVTPDFYANPADREQFLSALEENGQIRNFELVFKRRNGENFWSLVSANTIYFEKQPAILTSILDISDRKHAESLLIKQANELAAVAQVSTAASTILDPIKLLQQVVDLVKSSFNLYHAHIHLLDDSGQNLVLTAGAGEIGRQMVAEGRTISLSAQGSLVASVARQRQGAIRNYEKQGDGFMPHPLLMDTHSEMALPILSEDELLGVLDVRSTVYGYFNEPEMQTYMTLAAQISIALQNARSFTHSGKVVQELQALSNRLTREGWEQYLSERNDDLTYLFRANSQNGDAATVVETNTAVPALSYDLNIQGVPIGQLQVDTPAEYKNEANEIITAVTERLSVHLENLRLAESSEAARANAERRSRELGLINRMMSSVTASFDLIGNMATIARELAEAIDVSHVGIALITDDKKFLEVVTEYPEPTDDVIGTLIPLEGNPLTEQAIESKKFSIAYDAQNNPLTAPLHELMRHRNVHALAVVPMIVGTEFFGTVGFDLTDPHRIITEPQMRLAETIVYQAATVVQNARLFDQTQKALATTHEQARRLALLNELSDMVSRQLTQIDVVETAMKKVTEILEGKRISLHFIDEKDPTMLRVVGVAGEVADTDIGELIPLEGSPMGEALSTGHIAEGFFEIDDEPFAAYFVPMIAGEHKFGTFNLALNNQDAELDENQRQIMLQIASILTAALENVRLFEQTRRRAERERLLNKIVTQVAASLDLQHSLQIIVDEMATALNVDQVRVALIQPNGREMLIIAEHFSNQTPSAVGLTIPLEGNLLTQEVINTRKMAVVGDAQNNERTAPVHDLFRQQGIQTVVLLPLVVNDEVLGTIGLDILDERVFEHETLQLAETIVYQAAVAIQNARLFEKSQAALAETETLYAYTSQLNTSTNLDAVLDSAAAPGFQVGASDALLFVYDHDSTGKVGTGRFLASSPKNIVPIGESLPLHGQPFSRLWPSGGKNILFVGDITEDERLSAEEKQAFLETDVHALAIMFLSIGNLRLGQVIIRWQNKQTFTVVDERLYGAIAQQASSVVYNRLLFNQTEEALSETAALYQASVDLNAAGAYDQILNALRQHTILGQGSSDVSLNFFNRPWEADDMPETVEVLARWTTLPHELPKRYPLTAFPEAEKVLKPDEWLICADVATDQRMTERTRAIFMNRFNAKSLLYVPLVVGGQWIGFLNGVYSHSREFPEAQIRRLNVLARQAAVSIRSLQLLTQTRRRADREAMINSINQKIQSAPTVEFALQTAVAELSQALRLKKAAIELVSDQTSTQKGHKNGQNGHSGNK